MAYLQRVPTNAGYDECARLNEVMGGWWWLTARSPNSVTVPPGLLILQIPHSHRLDRLGF